MMMRPAGLLLTVALWANAGCRPGSTTTDRIPFVDHGSLPFERLGQRLEATFSVPHEPESPAMALRLTADSPRPPRPTPLCFQLTEVSTASGELLTRTGPADGLHCHACAHRAFFGAGTGLYVFPNNGRDLVIGEALRVRVTAADCDTLTPLPSTTSMDGARLRVEALDLLEPLPTTPGRLRLELTIDATSPFASEPEPLAYPTLQAAVAGLQELLAPARLTLDVTSEVSSAPAPDPLRLWWGSSEAWRPLARADAVDEPSLSLRLAGCLQVGAPWESVVSEPTGFAPRIPGTAADPLLLKGRGCSASAPPIDWPAGMLAKVMAHELGHALGLYHTVEASGLVDHLDDTEAQNLMYFDPLTSRAEGLSAQQLRVLRLHPAIRWEAP